MFHRVAYIAGLAASIATIPQAVSVWTTEDVSGVSLATWISYLVIAIILGMYGKIHRERLMVVMYTLLALVQIVIITGIVLR